MDLWRRPLESMVIKPEFWKNKKVLITGNTGFKGSWLSILLSYLGANVKGYSQPPPTKTNLFQLSGIDAHFETQFSDIRDLHTLRKFVDSFNPEIIFHLAAQSLVRVSYTEPVDTYETNIMGTVNVLEVARAAPNLEAVINVTSDKCYDNNENKLPFKEDDPMGGHDPYSSSKGCAELVTKAYRSSFFSDFKKNISVSTVRAGNVIGGGDWSVDRIIPDFFRAFESKKKLKIRNPNSVRPWQHVLEPLSGYLFLAQNMLADNKKFSQAWNFGPEPSSIKNVKWLVDELAKEWSTVDIDYSESKIEEFHEANFLSLDISKVKSDLGWHPKLDATEVIQLINNFYSALYSNKNILDKTVEQIKNYIN